MTDLLSSSSVLARERMIAELAADETFRAYPHDPTEIAQVVAGLALAARDTRLEYLATPDDVTAVAELVAFHLGVVDFVEAGVLARESFLTQEQARLH